MSFSFFFPPLSFGFDEHGILSSILKLIYNFQYTRIMIPSIPHEDGTAQREDLRWVCISSKRPIHRVLVSCSWSFI